MTEKSLTIDKNGKNKPIELWWFDKEEKSYEPAGVAFYDEKFGEYRLKIDINPDTCYYLKPIATQEDQTSYRVEVVIKKSDGEFKFRRPVGKGYSNTMSSGDVVMQLGPYSKLLILGDNNHE